MNQISAIEARWTFRAHGEQGNFYDFSTKFGNERMIRNCLLTELQHDVPIFIVKQVMCIYLHVRDSRTLHKKQC